MQLLFSIFDRGGVARGIHLHTELRQFREFCVDGLEGARCALQVAEFVRVVRLVLQPPLHPHTQLHIPLDGVNLVVLDADLILRGVEQLLGRGQLLLVLLDLRFGLVRL